MLQKLNERLQGIFAWAIIVLVAITFTFFGIDYYIQSRQTVSDVVLEVNGLPITKEMVNLRLERARRIQGTTSEFDEENYRQNIIDGLVDNQISLQAATTNGFYVSGSQAFQAILQLTEFHEKGQFSSERYQQLLHGALYTHESFQQEIQQQMLLQQQRFAFLATDFVLPNELETYVKSQYQSRQYRYLNIPIELTLKKQHISIEEAQDYYQKHLSSFMAPEAVSLEYVKLSMFDIKRKLSVTERELKQYYHENQSNFTTDGKVRSFEKVKNVIRKQLVLEKAQTEYAKLLENLSEVSYQTPGELSSTAKSLDLPLEHTDFFTKKGDKSALAANPQVVKLAFSEALLVSGDNSNPVQLDAETVVVFRVLEHVPTKQRSFEDVKLRVEHRLQYEKAKRELKSFAEQLSRANEDERKKLMAEYGLVWHEVKDESRNAVDTLAHQLVFDAKQPGDVLNAFSNHSQVVVQLQSITDGHLSKLTREQQAEISQKLGLQRGFAEYDTYLSALKKSAKLEPSK